MNLEDLMGQTEKYCTNSYMCNLKNTKIEVKPIETDYKMVVTRGWEVGEMGKY